MVSYPFTVRDFHSLLLAGLSGAPHDPAARPGSRGETNGNGYITQLTDAITNVGATHNTKAQHFLFATGQQVGSLQHTGVSYIGTKATFDVNYEPVSAHYPASVPSEVVVQEGDTLRKIAARVLGDGSLWYLIAQENGLTDADAFLTTGRSLRIPNNVVSLKNDATSFQPFSVSDALGDTTPTQPMPPPPAPQSRSKGCGVLGQILMIVVAIVVTVYTAGAAGSAFAGSTAISGAATGTTLASAGTWAAGTAVLSGAAGTSAAVIGAAAIGGAAGSIASQLVGNATGNVDGFDWKGVALGAIGAGVGSALGGSALLQSVTKGNAYLGAAVSGAAGNALVQGISVATGLQNKFSWRDVAISAIAAPAAGSVAKGAGAGFMGQVAGGLSGSLVRGALGGKIDIATVLADAFGNAIGNSIVSKATPQITTAGKGSASNSGNWDDELQEMQVTARKVDVNPSDTIRSGSEISGDELREIEVTAQRRDIPTTMTLGKGDTLWQVARRELGSKASDGSVLARVQQYMQANGVTDPSKLQAGQKLVTPAMTLEVSDVTQQNYAAHDAQVRQARAAQVATADSLGELSFMEASALAMSQAPATVQRTIAPGGELSGYAAREAFLQDMRASTTGAADGLRGGFWGDVAANTVDTFGLGGNTILRSGNSLLSLVTDSQYRSDVLSGIGNALAHPIQTYDNLVSATADFYGLSASEQARAAGDLGFGIAGGLGGTKAVSATTGFAVKLSGELKVLAGAAESGVVGAKYTFDALNPGPLADRVAGTFAGGRYSEGVIGESGLTLYKAGDSADPGGSFFTFEPPTGIAQSRIDSAIRPQWFDSQTGALMGKSPINSSISATFPQGTKYYFGPVGSQGGVYVGGVDRLQVVVPNARATGTFTILGPLK